MLKIKLPKLKKSLNSLDNNLKNLNKKNGEECNTLGTLNKVVNNKEISEEEKNAIKIKNLNNNNKIIYKMDFSILNLLVDFKKLIFPKLIVESRI